MASFVIVLQIIMRFDLLIVYHKHYIITLIVKLKIHQVVKNLVVRKNSFHQLKSCW